MKKEENSLNFVRPTKFQVRLSSAGTDTFSGSYKKLTDKSALRLLFLVVDILSKDFVNEKERYVLQYHLACAILKSLEFDKRKLFEHINKAEKFFEQWELEQ